MAGRKKAAEQKLTRSDIESHTKAFLKKGGKVTQIPTGKSGDKRNLATKTN